MLLLVYTIFIRQNLGRAPYFMEKEKTAGASPTV
jgi:hypothetical protein